MPNYTLYLPNIKITLTRLTKYFDLFAILSKFRQIWSHRIQSLEIGCALSQNKCYDVNIIHRHCEQRLSLGRVPGHVEEDLQRQRRGRLTLRPTQHQSHGGES